MAKSLANLLKREAMNNRGGVKYANDTPIADLAGLEVWDAHYAVEILTDRPVAQMGESG